MFHDLIVQFLRMIGYSLLGIVGMAVLFFVAIGIPTLYQDWKHKRYLRKCELYKLEADLNAAHPMFGYDDDTFYEHEEPFEMGEETKEFFAIVGDISAEQQRNGMSIDPYDSEEIPPLMVFTYRDKTATFFKHVDGVPYGSG